MDYCVGSPCLISKFIEHIGHEWEIGNSAQVNYLQSISELMDFRKARGVSWETLRTFSSAEVYIKRGKRTLTKRKILDWSRDLDIDTLNERNCWATLSELSKVVPFHSDRYDDILRRAKDGSSLDTITPGELTFATRFIAVYLFTKVKGSRPMTYQFLTIPMLEKAKDNGGYVDQTEFKTAEQYMFDSVAFDEPSLTMLDQYVKHIRPLLQPRCNYVLVTRNGTQYSKLCDLMSVLVFQAIGKYIHPTRFRQIVETESANRLSIEEKDLITKDQKHSSRVAEIYYRKQSSREIALKARECMKKLQDSPDEIKKDFSADSFEEKSHTDFKNRLRPRAGSCVRLKGQQKHHAQRKVRTPYSKLEDEQIITGIKKYGFGCWSSILQDKCYTFHVNRTPDSIKRCASCLVLNS